ncbi:MAG: deoxynucleoside kinase, partial [Oscillospiraceae bacterium]|nr:deoxynucleoside kinase [Oscillospiraceae bacterium]
MTPTLIVLEGLDGAGKSTQLQCLAAALREKGYAVRTISFPDYKDDSSALVRMYLNGEFGGSPYDTNAYAASLLYAADRFASFRRYWQQDYENGVIVLADRYAQSNIIHQMHKLEENEWKAYIDWLYDMEFAKMGIPKPDCVLMLDVDPAISQRMVLSRYGGDTSRQDIHERDDSYLRNCRRAAQYAADYLDWSVVRCDDGESMRSVEQIAQSVLEAVQPVLAARA